MQIVDRFTTITITTKGEVLMTRVITYRQAQDAGIKELMSASDPTTLDEPVAISVINMTYGPQVAIKCLAAVPGTELVLCAIAADLAEAVLPVFENAVPNDDRPRKAIEAARNYIKVCEEENAQSEKAKAAKK